MQDKEVWDCVNNKFVPMPLQLEVFLYDIVQVYKKHGLSISHEDEHGAFIIEDFNEDNINLLKACQKNYK